MLKKKLIKIYFNKNILIKKFNIKNNKIKLCFISKFGKLIYIFSKNVKIKINNIKKYLKIQQKKKNLLYYNLYFSLLNNIIFSINGGYFIKLNLKGRGFNIKISKKKNIIELKLGFSHIIRLYLNKNMIIKKINKLQIIIFSLFFNDVKNYSKILKNFKKLNIYKGKGFLYEKENIKLKEGKKKY